MEPLQGFTIIPAEDEGLSSALVSAEGRNVATVQGQVLEQVYRCSRGVLVITSDGNPFEESLHFHLFDEQMKELDGLSLGQIYHSGSLREVAACGADCLEFSFFGEERWRLTVLEHSRLRWWPKLFSSVQEHRTGLRGHCLELRRVGARERQ